MSKPCLYVIGSLRNPTIPELAKYLREETKLELFDDWWSASEDADEWWQHHETYKGRSYQDAINGYHAEHVFSFDLHHLQRSAGGILTLPCGKSGHLEFGFLMGQGKRGYILFDREPDRFDIMYRFANGGVFFNKADLAAQIKKDFSV